MTRADRRRHAKEQARKAERLASLQAERVARLRRQDAQSRTGPKVRDPTRPSFLGVLLRRIWHVETEGLLWVMRGAARLIGVDPGNSSKVGRGKIRP